MNLRERAKGALSILFRGYLAPFNQIDLGSSVGREKMGRPYGQSLWVARAIKHVAEPCTTVPLRFGTERRGDGLEIPALSEFWQEPAEGVAGPMCWRDVVMASIGWLKLAGEIFWVLDDAATTSSNVPFPEVGLSPRRFMVVRPDRMRHVTENNGRGRIVGWEMTDASGRRVHLLPEQVIHGKLWNPYDDYRGLSEYEQAQVAADGDFAGANFKLNIARNNGDQGVYVVAKSGIPDDTQRKQIIAQLREKRAMQQAGHFKPVFLTGDISIEDPKVRTVDAAFLTGQQADAHRIYVAFGVPPSMADVVAQYSVGSASDYYRLIRDTCAQAGVHLCELIETVLRRQNTTPTGERLYCWLDWSEHPVMREVRKEAADTATKYWDRGLPWEVLNDMLDLGMPKFAGWEKGYLPLNIAPAEESGSLPADVPPPAGPAGDTDPADIADSSPVGEAIGALRAKARWQKARDPKEVALWKSHMAKRQRVAKIYATKVRRQLFLARTSILAKLSAQRTTAAVAQRASAWDFIFSLVEFTEGLIAALNPVAATALQTAGDELREELDLADDPWKMPDAMVTSFLAERKNKLSGVADNIFADVRKELQAGIDAGETMDQLADRVRAQFNDMAKSRAERIAMTETGAAYGVARQAAMRDAGVQWKKWLSSGLDNVRPAHQLANGQVVAITEKFGVGGEALEHPGDPHGSPGNVINCHCVSVASAEGPAT